MKTKKLSYMGSLIVNDQLLFLLSHEISMAHSRLGWGPIYPHPFFKRKWIIGCKWSGKYCDMGTSPCTCCSSKTWSGKYCDPRTFPLHVLQFQDMVGKLLWSEDFSPARVAIPRQHKFRTKMVRFISLNGKVSVAFILQSLAIWFPR